MVLKSLYRTKQNETYLVKNKSENQLIIDPWSHFKSQGSNITKMSLHDHVMKYNWSLVQAKPPKSMHRIRNRRININFDIYVLCVSFLRLMKI